MQCTAMQRRSSLSARRCRRTLAAYPQTRRGASSPAVWPCCGRGLPGRPCRHGRRWSLTPPFHPYRARRAGPGGLLSVALSRGFPRVGVTHRPPLRSPDVPRRVAAEAARDATVRSTHSASSLTDRRRKELNGERRKELGKRAHQGRRGVGMAGRPSACAQHSSSCAQDDGSCYSVSARRTRIAPLCGQNTISSSSAARMSLSSAGASAMLLASETLPRSRAAPTPMRPRSCS